MSEQKRLTEVLIAQIQVNFALMNTLIEFMNATSLQENQKVVKALMKASRENGELINLINQKNISDEQSDE